MVPTAPSVAELCRRRLAAWVPQGGLQQPGVVRMRRRWRRQGDPAVLVNCCLRHALVPALALGVGRGGRERERELVVVERACVQVCSMS